MNDPQATSHDAPAEPRGAIAILLSFIAPGLGQMYVGRLMAGLVINLFFVLIVLLFVIAATLFQFFPLYPVLVLILVWVAMCLLSGWRAAEIIGDGRARKGRAFQHPLIYILVALSTFAAPLAITTHFTWRHLMTVVSVEDPAMFPQAKPGDRLIIDRTVYRNRPPRRGDVVTVRVPGSDDLVNLRVVALPSERVTMEGFVLRVDNRPAHYSPLDVEAINTAAIDEELPLELWVEHNHDQRYVISSIAGASTSSLNSPRVLGDDEYFLLADNRSAVDDNGEPTHLDSRHFGAVDAGHIEGRPVYVGWSIAPENGSIRWDRLALPID